MTAREEIRYVVGYNVVALFLAISIFFFGVEPGLIVLYPWTVGLLMIGWIAWRKSDTCARRKLAPGSPASRRDLTA